MNFSLMDKKFIVGLAVLVILAAFGLVFYFIYQPQITSKISGNSNNATSSINIISDPSSVIPAEAGIQDQEEQEVYELETGNFDTSDWLIYRNEEYGFEFKYPREIEGIYFKTTASKLKSVNQSESPLLSVNVLFSELDGRFLQDYFVNFLVFDKNVNRESLFFTRVNKNPTIIKLSNKSFRGYYSLNPTESDLDTMISYEVFFELNEYKYIFNGGGCMGVNQETSRLCKGIYNNVLISNVILDSLLFF